jgi:hypothetical protein
MQDADGRQVSGGSRRLGAFTAIAVGFGIAFLVYGWSHQNGRGVVILVVAGVALGGVILMWTCIAVTQWRQRNLEPPR